jgi:DNA polymerase III delta prime subunit
MDAQSALRRCIELFNHTTRFFIIVEDKYKLLKPILSRFCEIYVYEPEYNDQTINLYQYNLNETFKLKAYKSRRMDWIKKELIKPIHTDEEVIQTTLKLYEKGYSGLDILALLESNYFTHIEQVKLYEFLMVFNKVRRDIKNEKNLIYFMLHFIFLEVEASLDNISFM